MATDPQIETPTPPIARPRVYIDTTVISLLTARRSRDKVTAGRQDLTREWWILDRSSFEPCISMHVREEAGKGDSKAAAKRLAAIDGFFILAAIDAANALADELVRQNALPIEAVADALHVAIAAVWQVPYLITWNMKHINNARMRPVIQSVCASAGFEAPIISAPDELRGERS